ncbi:MAG: type II secretion system F family protein [Acidobacteria bacterium]|nr:type II secretion system F family protein [Acidobacteriota bacterium]
MGAVQLATFVGVLSVILGAYWVAVGNVEAREQRQLRRRLKAEDVSPVRSTAAGSVQLLKQEQRLSNIDHLNAMLASSRLVVDPARTLIDDSGLKLTVGRFILMILVCFFGTAAAVNHYRPVVWMVVPAALAGAAVPWLVVSFFRNRRLRQFEAQFPEAVELIARSLRAGHAFTTGLKLAADELPAPAGPEFRALYDRQNFGAPIPEALRMFAQRVPTLDARFFVTAVLTQREAGGNLAEILERLAGVMRERFRIRQEVRTRSAHGRVTAWVLASMPPVLAVLMTLSNPSHMAVMIADPLGVKMVMAGVAMQLVGMLLVRKIVDIQY